MNGFLNNTTSEIIESITTSLDSSPNNSTSSSFIDSSSPNIVCNEQYMSNFGHNKCKESCKEGYCCFQNDNDSTTQCSSSNNSNIALLDCKVYDSCSIIYANNSTEHRNKK